jgi:hypothetical protein
MKTLYLLHSVLRTAHERVTAPHDRESLLVTSREEKKGTPLPGGGSGAPPSSSAGGADGEDELDRGACRTQGNT